MLNRLWICACVLLLTLSASCGIGNDSNDSDSGSSRSAGVSLHNYPIDFQWLDGYIYHESSRLITGPSSIRANYLPSYLTVINIKIIDGAGKVWYDVDMPPSANIGLDFTLDPGVYTFFATAKTTTGDTFTAQETVTLGAGAGHNISLDLALNLPPKITSIAAPSSAQKGEKTTITATANDQDDDNLAFTTSASNGTLAKNAPSRSSFSNALISAFTETFSFGWTAPDRSQSSQITVTVNDGHGGVDVDSVFINSVNTAPRVSATASPTSVNIGEQVTFTCNADDSDSVDSGKLNISWSNPPGGSVTGSRLVSTYAPTSAGTVSATCTATDSDGKSASATVSVVVGSPNSAPSATASASPMSASVGDTITYTCDGTDPDTADSGNLSIQWSNPPGGSTTGSQLVSTWVATSAGSFVSTCTVTDSSGASANVRVTVVVSAVNTAPTVAATASPNSVNIGDTITYTCDATDPDTADSGNLAIDWTTPPGGSTTGSQLVSTYTAVTDGTFISTCTATDSQGASDSASVSVIVGVPNNAPVVTASVSPSSGNVGDTFTFTCDATDPDPADNGNLIIAWLTNPPGASSTVGSQLVSTWVATASGTFTATCKGSDTQGASTTDSVTVSVGAVNNFPTVTITASPSSVITGQNITFTCDATDPDPADNGNLTIEFTTAVPGVKSTVGSQLVSTWTSTVPGTFTATCKAIDPQGARISASVNVTVSDIVFGGTIPDVCAILGGDAWLVTVQSGVNYSVTCTISTAFDLMIDLLDTGGVFLVGADNGFAGSSETISWTPTTSGDYTLEMFGFAVFQGGIGTYSCTFSGAQPSAATQSVDNGALVGGGCV